MATQFKPVRLTVLIGLAALIVCGVAVFNSHRTAHGTTAEERAVYELGEKAGEQAPRGATLPTEAELNVTAQKYFEQQGPAEQLQNPSRAADLEAFKQAFQRGYTAGFKKTHPQQ
jgi:flagellar biosynthesis/type III secretory pathway protein FliH